jgi:hypothetical protein
VRRPGSEQLDHGHRTNIAAVQHGIDLEAFKHPHGRAS